VVAVSLCPIGILRQGEKLGDSRKQLWRGRPGEPPHFRDFELFDLFALVD
jgi:hypothetical protein